MCISGCQAHLKIRGQWALILLVASRNEEFFWGGQDKDDHFFSTSLRLNKSTISRRIFSLKFRLLQKKLLFEKKLFRVQEIFYSSSFFGFCFDQLHINSRSLASSSCILIPFVSCFCIHAVTFDRFDQGYIPKPSFPPEIPSSSEWRWFGFDSCEDNVWHF